MFHAREALNAHALVTGSLNEEYVVGLCSKLEHHRCVIKLRACVGADDSTAASVASEEKNIKRVGLLDKLSFCHLFLSPKLFRLGRQRSLFVTL